MFRLTFPRGNKLSSFFWAIRGCTSSSPPPLFLMLLCFALLCVNIDNFLLTWQEWITVFEAMSDSRERLSTLAHLWNQCETPDRWERETKRERGRGRGREREGCQVFELKRRGLCGWFDLIWLVVWFVGWLVGWLICCLIWFGLINWFGWFYLMWVIDLLVGWWIWFDLIWLMEWYACCLVY